MQIDSDSGLLTWNPDAGLVGTFPLRVQVADGRGGVDIQSFEIQIGAEGSGTIRGTKFDDENGNGIRDFSTSGQSFQAIRIGDLDGFGFGDVSGLVSAQNGPADVDGNGILQQTEFLPSLNGDTMVASTGGGDNFDNRSADEIAGDLITGSGFTDRDSSGSEWTDISLSTSFNGSNFPDPTGVARPTNRVSSFLLKLRHLT